MAAKRTGKKPRKPSYAQLERKLNQATKELLKLDLLIRKLAMNTCTNRDALAGRTRAKKK
jgi:hypothetical protein